MISSVSAHLIRYMVNPGFSCNELGAERAITPFFPRSQGIATFTVPVLTSEQRYASSAEDLGCVVGVRTHCVQGNRITPHRADSSKNIFLFSWSNEGTTLIGTSAYEMSHWLFRRGWLDRTDHWYQAVARGAAIATPRPLLVILPLILVYLVVHLQSITASQSSFRLCP